jgi:hypothetical protein
LITIVAGFMSFWIIQDFPDNAKYVSLVLTWLHSLTSLDSWLKRRELSLFDVCRKMTSSVPRESIWDGNQLSWPLRTGKLGYPVRMPCSLLSRLYNSSISGCLYWCRRTFVCFRIVFAYDHQSSKFTRII